MRGIINYIRGFITEAQEFGLAAAVQELRADFARTVESHADLSGGLEHGIYLRLPYTRLSAWLELWEVNNGIGIGRHGANISLFMGRLNVVFSSEPAFYTGRSL